eukprot:364980-Chlamydomonas_euryale.AAC.14
MRAQPCRCRWPSWAHAAAARPPRRARGDGAERDTHSAFLPLQLRQARFVISPLAGWRWQKPARAVAVARAAVAAAAAAAASARDISPLPLSGRGFVGGGRPRAVTRGQPPASEILGTERQAATVAAAVCATQQQHSSERTGLALRQIRSSSGSGNGGGRPAVVGQARRVERWFALSGRTRTRARRGVACLRACAARCVTRWSHACTCMPMPRS